MNELNILILSAGRRVELVQHFQRAAKALNIRSTIVAGDCSDTAPALYFADKTCTLPRINESNYIDAIIDVCNRENIALIVPTIDTDLMLLAENRADMERQTNVKVLISDTDVISICRNKINTQRFLEDYGFNVPNMYTDDELNHNHLPFPLFMKPASGSSSVDTFKVNNPEELQVCKRLIQDPIIQDYLEGEEYTVDVFLDFDGNVITIVPRLRITTRGGEIAKGKIIKDPEIIANVARLMEILQPIGHITVQLMKTQRGIDYIEINPRFGGGAPMSIQSGADSCKNLYRLLLGEKLEYNEKYEDHLTFLRFDSSICLDENMELKHDQSSYI